MHPGVQADDFIGYWQSAYSIVQVRTASVIAEMELEKMGKK